MTPCPSADGKPSDNRDFGPEAVTEIVNFVDKYIGMSIVIVAGYENMMKRCFMASNEGLPRRFPFQYVLRDYTDANLADIMINLASKKGVKFDEDTSNFIYSLIAKLRGNEPLLFSNQAGDMLNLAGMLVRYVFSSYKIKWKPNDLSNNTPIILAAFDEYATQKGFEIDISN